MDVYQSDDLAWTLQRMNDRVSFSGWFLALIAGSCLWALMFRMLV